jgi:hypothetical protein
MGWQESRVTLLPPGWRQVIETSPRARTLGGVPVRIARAVREEDGPAERLRPDAVRGWLERHGFAVSERGKGATALRREDMLAECYEQEGELAELLLTFTLSRDAPSRWDTWHTLVAELSAAWGLRLADGAAGGRLVGPDELLRLLSQTVSWQDFQTHFGWPNVTSISR